jgi:hypothetical protein
MKAIVFCVTRAHMACVAACVQEMAGDIGLELPIAMVDGTTPPGDRDRILAEFHAHPSGEGRGRWLLNVDVCTEGFDVPDVEALVINRPTLARSRYMQMVGRALRPLDGIVDDVDPDVRILLGSPGTEHLASVAHMLDDVALMRRLAIATSTKPSALILDFAGNADRHELANPIDLLGGDFDPVEQRMAQRLVKEGQAASLWEALEMARASRAGAKQERLARAGDPFALFGIPLPARSRWGSRPTPKQRAVIDALRQPRIIEDVREAEVLIRELARRDAAGLALYSQAALLAALGHDLDMVRAMGRQDAGGLVRAAAANRWRRVETP